MNKKVRFFLLGLATMLLLASSGASAFTDCGQLVMRDASQKVLCCCRTFNGTCCNYVYFCSGWVPGCNCTG